MVSGVSLWSLSLTRIIIIILAALVVAQSLSLDWPAAGTSLVADNSDVALVALTVRDEHGRCVSGRGEAPSAGGKGR
jgi:hypothetical protein